MTYNNQGIEIIQGDITRVEAECIVNAANATLLGGGGVDGAIHQAAGPKLLEECKEIGGCPPGEARITKGYQLKAKYVIHTVGPIYRDGNHHEKEILEKCYENSLKLADDHEMKSIAFPSISTGAYHYPIHLACSIAVSTVRRVYPDLKNINKVIFTLYSTKDFNIYLDELQKS